MKKAEEIEMRETILIETIGYEDPKTATELINILRWEDDGGFITDPGTPSMNIFFNRFLPEYEAIQNGSLPN